LKINYNAIDIFQILLDSFRYNDIRWVKDSEAASNDFKFIQWPDILIKTKVGICQDFAIFAYLVAKYIKISCGLVFIIIMDARTGDIQYGHVYPILCINNTFWFWNYSEYIASMHGPYLRLDDCYGSSSEYFRALFHAEEFKNYNPLHLNIASNPKAMFNCFVYNDDLLYIDENYNKKISKTNLWKNIDSVNNMARKAIDVSNRIKFGTNADFLPPPTSLTKIISNISFSIPVKKNVFYQSIKNIGKIYHIIK